MVFEVGKCYKHESGKKIRIIGEVDTYFYGHCLIAETDNAVLIPVGQTEEYAVNWTECEYFTEDLKNAGPDN